MAGGCEVVASTAFMETCNPGVLPSHNFDILDRFLNLFHFSFSLNKVCKTILPISKLVKSKRKGASELVRRTVKYYTAGVKAVTPPHPPTTHVTNPQSPLIQPAPS